MTRSLLRLVSVFLAVLFSTFATSAQAQQEKQEALMTAIKEGDIRAVQSLLGEVNPNFFFNGETPLMRAAAKNFPQITEELLQRGANPDAQVNGRGKTALMFAAEKDRYGNIEKLLAYGARADLADESAVRKTALMYAAKKGCVTSVSYLLNAGPRNLRISREDYIDMPDTNGSTALYYAVTREHNANAVRILLEAGADPLQPASNGKTPLALAAEYHETGYIQEMVKHLTEQERARPEVKRFLEEAAK